MIQRATMFIATLLMISVFAQAEKAAQKTENSDTVEAIAEDVTKATEEENISDEVNASEVITPLEEEKQKPAM